MDKSIRAWTKSVKAWLKTQQTNIDSCALNIKHSQEQIRLLNKAIQLEKAEMKLKIQHRDKVKGDLGQVIKEGK